MDYTYLDLAKMIDHSLLNPVLTDRELDMTANIGKVLSGDRAFVVKAAGGVRTSDPLVEVRSIGVARSGATRTAEMLNECKRRLAAEG